MFLGNVSKMLKKGGMFAGCAFDARSVLSLLGDENKVVRNVDDKLIWSIEKNFDDEISKDMDLIPTGKTINVYIETINAIHQEYLMDLNQLLSVAERHGMRLMTPAEAKALNIGDSGSELFRETYSNNNVKLVGKTRNMSLIEREFSFLNRWFILIKV